MMKYLKAEAEIIKFDNSDVVTNSKQVEEQAKRCMWSIPGFAWAWWCLLSGNGSFMPNGTVSFDDWFKGERQGSGMETQSLDLKDENSSLNDW